jgi:NAD(P)-dependent dehydrogenase (short-subunit alcohol dehydrogenase family)
MTQVTEGDTRMARFRLDGKIAFVTGGGSGIGAAICRAFAEQGARVVIADVNPASGQRIASELGEAGWFQ